MDEVAIADGYTLRKRPGAFEIIRAADNKSRMVIAQNGDVLYSFLLALWDEATSE